MILIAFDASGGSLAGIAAAARLAPSVLVPFTMRAIDRRHVAPMRFALIWVFAHTACELLRIDHETFLDVVVGGRSGGDHVRVLAAQRVDENNRRGQ